MIPRVAHPANLLDNSSAASSATTTPPIHTIRLRLWLPLLVVAIGVLAFTLLLGLERLNYQRELEIFTKRTAYDELLHTKRHLETVLRRDDGTGLDAVISQLGLEPAVTYAALLDEKGYVLAATRFAWRGQHIGQVRADFPHALAQQLQQQRTEVFDLNLDQRKVHALLPITMALRPNEIRSQRQGTLWLQYDLSPIAQQSWQNMLHQAGVFAMVSLLTVVLLLLLARQHILRPMAALQRSMAAIGSGQPATARMTGQGEFKILDDTLVDMAHSLSHSRTALQESEARFRQLSDASFEALFLHENGIIIDANAAAERLLDVAPGSLVGRNIFDFVANHDQEGIRKRAQRGTEGTWSIDMIDSQGKAIAAEVSARQSKVGGRTLRTVAIRDIRQRLQAEAEIRQLTNFDPLTGLPNRRMLLECVASELAAVDLGQHRSALAALNLDGFKTINDSLGMAMGDAVLRAMARRMQQRVRHGQALARVNGDTFALLLSDLGNTLEEASAAAANVVESMLACISEPLHVEGQTLHLTAGAGLVMIPNDSRDPPELLREAETAMHLAKQSGNSRVHFFAHALQEAASARLTLRNDLKKTLDTDTSQLLLHFQPQMNAQGQLQGVEALVRWQHPQRGMVPPGAFIGEAESSGLIVPLGNWVLHQAAATLRQWQQDPRNAAWAGSLSMAVNVSPRQFREPNFVQHVCDTLDTLNLKGLSLELELTESVVADDLDATIEKMHELRKHGVHFALDDFGTGYSSLSYLKRLPIDTLKIDRSFVMDIDAQEASAPGGKRPAVLIEAIIAMAHQLDMQVLAEGVETEAQRAHLQQAGCDIFQGYYFSRPLASEQLQAWALEHSGSNIKK